VDVKQPQQGRGVFFVKREEVFEGGILVIVQEVREDA
jgi:hypothetical protein